MKFLLMIRHAENPKLENLPQSLYTTMEAFVGEGFKKGWLKDTAGLKGTAEGLRIKSRGGKLVTVDGPFSETKEIVGGYAIVETTTREEALELARQFMEIHREHVPEFECECEVRMAADL